jgi:hypothetical protein
MTALGHYTAFAGRYGERLSGRKIEGRLDRLQDATIEKWANWQGPTGVFAAALRELCTDGDSGELKGFRRRNAKILLKQVRDAQKRKNRPGADYGIGTNEPPAPLPPPEPSRVPSRVPWKNPHANVDDYENVNENKSASASCTPEATHEDGANLSSNVDDYVTRCTVACNRGLRENQSVGGCFSELVASKQDLPPTWLLQRVPIEVAEQAIYERAKQYVPRGNNRQPRNLNYFRDVVPEAWSQAQGRERERLFTPKTRGTEPRSLRPTNSIRRAT